MKKIYLIILPLLFFHFNYAQTFITVGSAGGAGSYAVATNTYGPFTTNTTASWNRHAYIYPASLLTGIPLNATIDSLFFPRVSLGGTDGMLSGIVNCKIYLKNTAVADFGAAALNWTTEVASNTLVFNDNPTSIIGNVGGFKKFILTAPFTYTGNNLEVLVEYTQSAPATGEVVWGYDNSSKIPEYIANSVKYISGTSGLPTNSLTNSELRHPAFAIFYTSNNSIDASVLGIIDPANVSCYNTPQNFSVLLKNDGNTPIAAGAAAVTLKISGANSSISTLNNVDIIAPGDIERIAFSGINITNPGINDDTAYVTLAGDVVNSNDTTSFQTLTAETISTFPAVEDAEGSLPVFSYVSVVAIDQAWGIQTGDYTNADQTDPLIPHGGTNFFLFDSYDYDAGTITRLYSNCLTLTNGGVTNLSFYVSHDNVFSTSLDSLYVTISTDKGVSWTRLAGYRRYDPAFATPDWKLESIDLSAYAGLTVQIGFEGVSDFGNSIGLDDITVVSSGVTPVTVTTFNARRSGSVNNLTWSTSQEFNSLYFAIERSSDGRNFTQIGQVAAAGNSSIQRTYQFTDPNPSKGINYYRLRIVDIDHSEKYSLIRSVKNRGLVTLNMYPNPVKEKLLLDIDAEKIGKVEIRISDVNGKNIYNDNVNLTLGINTIPVDVSRFAKGTYFLNIQMTDASFMKKFSKQ